MAAEGLCGSAGFARRLMMPVETFESTGTMLNDAGIESLYALDEHFVVVLGFDLYIG